MPALMHLAWPKLSRRLLVTGGVFLLAFLVVTVLVQTGSFAKLNLRTTHYLQARGSDGQNLALGLFAYLGSIEATLVIAILIGVALFRGLRLLAVLPAAVILFASGLEYVGKRLVVSHGPGAAFRPLSELLAHLEPQAGRLLLSERPRPASHRDLRIGALPGRALGTLRAGQLTAEPGAGFADLPDGLCRHLFGLALAR